MICVNQYHTHLCGEVSEADIGKKIRVAGWVENIRDHGGIQFLDVRDHYGVVQVVVYDEAMLSDVNRQCCITVEGEVILRSEDTINPKIATGKVEVKTETLTVLGKAPSSLPFEVDSSTDTKEDVRLKYRFLDLRNPKVHNNIVLRSQVISFLRNKMSELGFLDIQTPILSTSSPEGARDYLIPSRKHHGKFYALPQAPQIFKQLLMVSGFDRYFQVAPCFRDEDARADRSPGEFYQLDFEMAFATQEDVLQIAEEVISETFKKFSDKKVSDTPFPRIPYAEAMLRYGTDKPDLRNPLEIVDITDIFETSTFAPFKNKTVRAINVPNCASKPKSFFENMLKYATEELEMMGLGYIKVTDEMEFLGPINKFIPDDQRDNLIKKAGLVPGCVLYFIADETNAAAKLAGQIRAELGRRLELIDNSEFKMCFIVDFPMYEIDEETGAYIFTHNPFSMPQGGLQALLEKEPTEILAYQYDIVCNGVELSSGAVRNHDLPTMIKAFEIAGYTEEKIEENFPALYNAFKFGPPPHAGMAPGIDRMIMLLTDEENIREVIPFPMNSNAQDLLLGAPTEVTEQQLREVHIKIR